MNCTGFLLTAEFLFLNVMHSCSLLPNNCPKDQQLDRKEHFISLLVNFISAKEPEGAGLGGGDQAVITLVTAESQ